MGFEPMNLVLTKDALYRLSYSSVGFLPRWIQLSGIWRGLVAASCPLRLAMARFSGQSG